MASIVIADGDKELRSDLASALRESGHDVSEAGTADALKRLLVTEKPELALLECSLPDADGIDVLREIKAAEGSSPLRVLMTSGRRRVTDLVAAFEAGADDFVAKPYALEELMARTDVALRRPALFRGVGSMEAGGITIDAVSHRVFVDGDRIDLAPREYRLLLFMMENRERVFSRQQLLAHVWDPRTSVGARTVDVHIRRLRGVLEPYGYDDFLQTVRGSGYRFSPGPAAG